MFHPRAGAAATFAGFATCLAGVAACLLVATRTSRAGEVPATALAQSLQIEPLLLESPALTFQFPQWIAIQDTMALSFGRTRPRSEFFAATNANDFGIGATPRRESFGGFVYSQSGTLPDAAPQSYVDPRYNDSHVVQAGMGGRIRALRIGAAVRGTRLRHQERNTSASGSQLQRQTDHVEVAGGAGISGHGIVLDAVYEWGRTRYQAAQSYVTSSDTLVSRIEGEPRSGNRLVVRLAVPAGDRWRILAAGRISWDEVAWSGREFRDQQLRPVDRADRSKAWFTGISLRTLAEPHLDVVAVTGTFEHRTEVLLAADRTRGLAVAARKLDVAVLGVAAQRHLWRELWGQAGFAVTYTRDQVDDEFGRAPSGEQHAARDEAIADQFSWGLGWSWRNLDLAGSLRVPPRIDSPIGTIDVYVGF